MVENWSLKKKKVKKISKTPLIIQHLSANGKVNIVENTKEEVDKDNINYAEWEKKFFCI